MVLAADLSMRLGWMSSKDYQRTVALLQRLELPVSAPKIGTNARLS